MSAKSKKKNATAAYTTVADPTNIEHLDGCLHSLLRFAVSVKRISDSPVIAKCDSLIHGVYHIKKIIISARAAGCGWMWALSDIEESDTEEGGMYTLPSADLADLLGLESHNSMQSVYEKRFGKDEDIVWDTEHSAVYPKFMSTKSAERFIRNINDWFDGLYLKHANQ